jgi:hypothetical protein
VFVRGASTVTTAEPLQRLPAVDVSHRLGDRCQPMIDRRRLCPGRCDTSNWIAPPPASRPVKDFGHGFTGVSTPGAPGNPLRAEGLVTARRSNLPRDGCVRPGATSAAGQGFRSRRPARRVEHISRRQVVAHPCYATHLHPRVYNRRESAAKAAKRRGDDAAIGTGVGEGHPSPP